MDVYDIGENNYSIKENSLPQLNLILNRMG